MKLAHLFEDIYRSLSHPGTVDVIVNSHERKHRSGDEESIATATPLPLRRSASKTHGMPVYYAYGYQHSEEVSELLRALKGKSRLRVDERQLAHFFKDTVDYLVTGLKQRKVAPDVVVCPASSSTLVREFAVKLADKLGCKVVTDAFVKSKSFRLPDDREEAIKLCAEKLVDHDLVRAKYHGDDAEAFELKVATSVYQSLKRHGSLELKDVYKRYGKFVKGFMDRKPDIEYEVLGKSVLVIDDVMSSGSTMSEVMRLVRDECLAQEVNGAVIFNMTSQGKKRA